MMKLIDLEYYFYIAMFIFLLAIVMTSYKKEYVKYKCITSVVLIVIYCFIVRLFPHSDMNTYISAFLNPNFTLKNAYYLREWVFWGGGYYLTNYLFSGNYYYTFIVFDIITLCSVIYVFKKSSSTPVFYILLLYMSFPGIFGLQNILRQFMATVFCVTSFLLLQEKKTKASFLFFFIAFFCHNSIGVLIPILFLIKNKIKSFWVMSCIVFLALPILQSTKSSSETGLNLVLVYNFVLLILLFWFFYLNKFNPYKHEINLSLFLFLLTFFSSLVMGASQSERIGMMALIIQLPYICKSVNKNVYPYKIANILLCILLILPTFMFSSTLKMITNSFEYLK